MVKIDISELERINKWKFIGFEIIDGVLLPVFEDRQLTDANKIIVGLTKHWALLEEFCRFLSKDYIYFIAHEV